MESLKLLQDLERIPLPTAGASFKGIDDLPGVAWAIDAKLYGLETAQGLEDVSEALFDWRNVDDAMRALMEKAYPLAFTNSDVLLHEHFSQAMQNGQDAARGFVSALKGKMAEIENNAKLEQLFPGYTFELGPPTQPVWDHLGTSAHGPEIAIQSKMGGDSYASEVVSRMDTNPDTTFMLSSDLYEGIGAARPDLVERMIDSEIENTTFTADVTENVTLLAENSGLDVPDGLGEALPYIGEAILAIRLMLDVVSVERDLKNFGRNQKTRLQALRALLLLQRLGVSAILVGGGGTLGAGAGTAIAPGPGSAVGGIAGSVAGAITAAQVNRLIRPHVLPFALQLTGMMPDDLFYFQNRRAIDAVGASLASTNLETNQRMAN